MPLECRITPKDYRRSGSLVNVTNVSEERRAIAVTLGSQTTEISSTKGIGVHYRIAKRIDLQNLSPNYLTAWLYKASATPVISQGAARLCLPFCRLGRCR